MDNKVLGNNSKIHILKKIIYFFFAVFLVFLLIEIIILSLGYSPKDFFYEIFISPFTDISRFGNLLGQLSWILIFGIAMVVSFRSGLFNIGSAGQFIAGGIVGYFFAVSTDWNGIGWIVTILISITVASLIGLLIGFLKVKYNIHEVFSSIMFNWIIFYFLVYVTTFGNIDFLLDASGTGLKKVADANSLKFDFLSSWFGGSEFINIGIFIAPIVFVVFLLAYKYTSWGYKQSIINSKNKSFKYVGINRDYEIMKNMAISGMLSGLAGAIFYFGINDNLLAPSGIIPAESFYGISASLIGFSTVPGTFFSSLLISMTYSTRSLNYSVVGSIPVSDLMIGFLVIFIPLSQYFEKNQTFEKIIDFLVLPINSKKILYYKSKVSKLEKRVSKQNLKAFQKDKLTSKLNAYYAKLSSLSEIIKTESLDNENLKLEEI